MERNCPRSPAAGALSEADGEMKETSGRDLARRGSAERRRPAPGLPLPTEDGLGLETADPAQRSTAAPRSSESPAPEPSSPRLRFPAGERRSPGSSLRGRRLLTAAPPASLAGCSCPPRPRASAVTRVTTTRPSLAALPARLDGRGPGGGAQGRNPTPPCAPSAPAPPTAAASQSGHAPRCRPRWRYAAFGQSRAPRPARRRRVRR